ncbi:hypothetical protein FNF29_06412 [Cafeteria roenbergensis]|nr:hypothetical protein FNF29_06412 [Cafeteria roenbergensis]|eukprot:KAA0148787.1 hypothetical protein FNF29_06412 [Cafeteria roenbergensis]
MTKVRDRVQVDVDSVDVGSAATADALAAVSTSEYEVQAIVEHHGRSSTCGHYTALGRDGSAWRDLNDHRVKMLSPRDARPAASEGFLFVLVRKGATSAEAAAREAFRALYVLRDEAEAAGASRRKRARLQPC